MKMKFFMVLICLAFVLVVQANPASERVESDVNERRFNLKFKDLKCNTSAHNQDHDSLKLYEKACVKSLQMLDKTYTEFCESSQNPDDLTAVTRPKRDIVLFWHLFWNAFNLFNTNVDDDDDLDIETSEKTRNQTLVISLVSQMFDRVEKTKGWLNNLKPYFRKTSFFLQLLNSLDFYPSEDRKELKEHFYHYLFRNCQFNREDWSFTLNSVKRNSD